MELQTSSLRIRKSWVIFLSLLYLALPNIIMMMAWVKPIPACLIIIGIIVSLVYYAVTQLRGEPGRSIPLTQKNAWLLLLTVLLVTMPFVHDGLVGLFETGWDYKIARQAYYSNLVDAPWPVIYEDGTTIAYYIGAYMVPAVLDRWLGISPGAGSMAAQFVLLAWIVIGLVLSLLLFFAQRRRISILFVVFFVLMGDPILQYWGTESGSHVIKGIADFCSSVSGMDWSILSWHTSRFALFSLSQTAGCYTSNIPAFMAASIIMNVRTDRNFILPLIFALLFFHSPFAALGCFPLALLSYDFVKLMKAKGCLYSLIGLVLPLAISAVALVYYSRIDVFCTDEEGSMMRLTTVFGMHGMKGMIAVFTGVLIPAMLFYAPLRKYLWRCRGICVCLLCLLACSQIWFGGVARGLNEFWLKISPIYTFVLASYLAYLWPRLGRDKWIPAFITLVMTVAFVVSLFARYTGQWHVDDDCNGHLYHERGGRNVVQKDVIPDLLYTKDGESETRFPGNLLPSGKGCDYGRPLLHPVKP